MTIGEKIKEIRTSKNMLIKELAEKSGLSVASIINYEKGKFKPNIISIKRIAEALNYDFDELYDLR